MTTSAALSSEPSRWTGSMLDVTQASTPPERLPLRVATMPNCYALTDFAVSLSASAGWIKQTRALTAKVILASAVVDAETIRAKSLISEGAKKFQDEYGSRFGELQDLALEEDIRPLRPEAKADFLAFLRNKGFPDGRASLALLDDGSLGAIWCNDKWRLNLRFNGNREIEYVLLDQTNPPEGKTGIKSLDHFEIKGIEITDILAG